MIDNELQDKCFLSLEDFMSDPYSYLEDDSFGIIQLFSNRLYKAFLFENNIKNTTIRSEKGSEG